jgi:hypothetical protein
MPPKTIPKKYTAGLKGKEKQAQIKSIKEGKPRPRTSAKSKPSSATVAFNKKYGKQLDKMKGGRSKRNISKVTGIPVKALDAVYDKGRGAYFSAGSRPNQTPDSWARARMYSYITGVGGARKADKEITKKFNVKF